MEEKKIIFTGGGSLGHVMPNVIMIDHIQKKAPQVHLHYAGKKNPVEQSPLIQRNIPYTSIMCGPLRRYISFRTIIDLCLTVIGFFQSLFFLKKNRPSCVFSTGGYVSFPICCAAKCLGVPIVLYESNHSPGLVSKIVAPWAEHVLLAHPKTKKVFHTNNTKIVGNLVKNIPFLPQKEAQEYFNIHTKKPVLLILGGSQGDKDINNAVLKHFDALTQKYTVLHVWGAKWFQKNPHPISSHYSPKKTLESHIIHKAYWAADIILTQCGMGTLSEIEQTQKPALLVPLSKKCSRGEQLENAHAYAQKNKNAYIVSQQEIENNLLACLSSVSQTKKEQKQNAKKQLNKSKNKPNASENIFLYIKKYF